MSLAIAVRTATNKWEVFCHDCRKTIGTMNSETLQRALAWSVGRGGVLCVECRAASCRRCHIVPRLTIPENGVCVFCTWELERGGEEEIVTAQSCLVDQKSRNYGT